MLFRVDRMNGKKVTENGRKKSFEKISKTNIAREIRAQEPNHAYTQQKKRKNRKKGIAFYLFAFFSDEILQMPPYLCIQVLGYWDLFVRVYDFFILHWENLELTRSEKKKILD